MRRISLVAALVLVWVVGPLWAADAPSAGKPTWLELAGSSGLAVGPDVGKSSGWLAQADEKAKGAYLLSDSFFPEPDSVRAAREYGIALIVQQGGSVRDKVCIAESLAETDELRAAGAAPIPMVITGQRCFYHGV